MISHLKLANFVDNLSEHCSFVEIDETIEHILGRVKSEKKGKGASSEVGAGIEKRRM